MKKTYKRKHKATISWENKFIPILQKHHGTHSKNVFHRLMKKSSTLRSTLKRRSKEYEVEFNISLEQVRNLFLKKYGDACPYCHKVLDVRTMVCDHMVPLSHGGPSILKNLEMICKRCNTRKGPLTTKEYFSVVKWLESQPEHVTNYIFRKLSSKDVFR